MPEAGKPGVILCIIFPTYIYICECSFYNMMMLAPLCRSVVLLNFSIIGHLSRLFFLTFYFMYTWALARFTRMLLGCSFFFFPVRCFFLHIYIYIYIYTFTGETKIGQTNTLRSSMYAGKHSASMGYTPLRQPSSSQKA